MAGIQDRHRQPHSKPRQTPHRSKSSWLRPASRLTCAIENASNPTSANVLFCRTHNRLAALRFLFFGTRSLWDGDHTHSIC